MDLTTTTRVRTLLEGGGIQQANLATLIAQAITDVSGYVERYLDRGAQVGARVEILDVQPLAQAFRLYGYPVTSFTDIRHDTGRGFAASTVVPSTAYVRDDTNGWVTFDRYFLADGPGVLRIAYSGGMAADTASFVAAFPAIASAVDQQVAALIQRRHSLSGQNVSAGNMSAGFVGAYDLLPSVTQVLNEYRRF